MVQPNASLGVSADSVFTAGDQKVLVSIIKSVLSYLAIDSPNPIISPEGGKWSP